MAPDSVISGSWCFPSQILGGVGCLAEEGGGTQAEVPWGRLLGCLQ